MAISKSESIAEAKIATEPLTIPAKSLITKSKKATLLAIRAAFFSIRRVYILSVIEKRRTNQHVGPQYTLLQFHSQHRVLFLKIHIEKYKVPNVNLYL